MQLSPTALPGTLNAAISPCVRARVENAVAESPQRYHTVAGMAQATQLEPDVVQAILESSPAIRRSFVLTPTGIHWYAARSKVSLLADLWMGFRAVNSLKYGTWR